MGSLKHRQGRDAARLAGSGAGAVCRNLRGRGGAGGRRAVTQGVTESTRTNRHIALRPDRNRADGPANRRGLRAAERCGAVTTWGKVLGTIQRHPASPALPFAAYSRRHDGCAARPVGLSAAGRRAQPAVHRHPLPTLPDALSGHAHRACGVVANCGPAAMPPAGGPVIAIRQSLGDPAGGTGSILHGRSHRCQPAVE